MIRQLENVYRVLADKEPIGPDVQENLAAILADVIAGLKAKEHSKPGPRPTDVPPHVPPLTGGG